MIYAQTRIEGKRYYVNREIGERDLKDQTGGGSLKAFGAAL